MKTRQCNMPGCTKKAAPGKRKCWAHVKAKYRADNPVKAAYQNLRTSARRRGKEFTLTFEEFCFDNKYIKGNAEKID